jgi:hypothetical protein
MVATSGERVREFYRTWPGARPSPMETSSLRGYGPLPRGVAIWNGHALRQLRMRPSHSIVGAVVICAGLRARPPAEPGTRRWDAEREARLGRWGWGWGWWPGGPWGERGGAVLGLGAPWDE